MNTVRCEGLVFQDDSLLTFKSGTYEGNGLNEFVAIAAQKLLVRAPTKSAKVVFGRDLGPWPKPPGQPERPKAPNGVALGSDGQSGFDGLDGTHAPEFRPGPYLMKNVFLIFDDIDITAPADPTINFPQLEVFARGKDGGLGGEGGDGARGTPSKGKGLFCDAGPGRGGDGGQGGRGTRGFQGGNVIILSTMRAIEKMIGFGFDMTGGLGGRSGLGMPGGRGGKGGPEGRLNFPCQSANRVGRKGPLGFPGGTHSLPWPDGPNGRVFIEQICDAEFQSLWP